MVGLPQDHQNKPVSKDVTLICYRNFGKSKEFDFVEKVAQCLSAIANFWLISFIISKEIDVSLLCALVGASSSIFSSFISYLSFSQKRSSEYKRYILHEQKI